MRSNRPNGQNSRFGFTLVLLAALCAGTSSHAQVVPTPGFPFVTYKVGKDSVVHFCRLTASELVYAEKKNGILKLINRNYLTGVDTAFDPIDALLSDRSSLLPQDVSVSPDRKWAAWPATSAGHDGVEIAGLVRDYHRFIQAPLVRLISWAPEPDEIICFSAEKSAYSRLAYYSILSGELESDFDIVRHGGLSGLDDGSGRRYMLCFTALINHRAWCVTIPPPFKTGSTRFLLGGSTVFEMYELSNTALAKTGYAIRLPDKCDLIQAVVSPHQKYVIWQLGFQQTTELWLSDMNGEHMRRAVTFVDPKNATYTDAEPPISDVLWVTGEREIGFRLRNTLFITQLDLDKDQPDP